MNRSILGAAVGAAVLAFAAVSQAQPAAAPDPVRLQLAKSVFEASGGAKGAETQMRALYGNVGAAMSRNVPPEQAKVGQQFMRDMQEEMVKLAPSIIDISATVYANNLSEKELRDLLAFYRSDSGQAMIQAMVPKLMQKTLDRACAEAQCTPEVRQIMAEAMAKSMGQPKS